MIAAWISLCACNVMQKGKICNCFCIYRVGFVYSANIVANSIKAHSSTEHSFNIRKSVAIQTIPFHLAICVYCVPALYIYICMYVYPHKVSIFYASFQNELSIRSYTTISHNFHSLFLLVVRPLLLSSICAPYFVSSICMHVWQLLNRIYTHTYTSFYPFIGCAHTHTQNIFVTINNCWWVSYTLDT